MKTTTHTMFGTSKQELLLINCVLVQRVSNIQQHISKYNIIQFIGECRKKLSQVCKNTE